VAVQKVSTSNVPAVYEYVGQTAGSRDVEVRARVAGILLKRNFAEGGAVRQGQSLYSLDPAPFQAALNRADADVASADAKLAQATRTLARLKPLWEARAVSQREYDDAASAEQIARADMKGAQAKRADAVLNVGYTKVESPISGVASRSQVSEGTLVSGPQVLLTTVTQTDPVKVRFGIADTDQMRWRAEVAAGALQLPAHEAFAVEVKLADGKAMPKPVTVGDQLADGWIISKGLQAGDNLIIDGMARIFFPGAPVQVAQAPAAGASAAAPAAKQ